MKRIGWLMALAAAVYVVFKSREDEARAAAEAWASQTDPVDDVQSSALCGEPSCEVRQGRPGS